MPNRYATSDTIQSVHHKICIADLAGNNILPSFETKQKIQEKIKGKIDGSMSGKQMKILPSLLIQYAFSLKKVSAQFCRYH